MELVIRPGMGTPILTYENGQPKIIYSKEKDMHKDNFIDWTSVAVGADPEFFVKIGNEFISGHDFPCGTKTHPRKTANGFVQCDGTALELNVEPAFTPSQFVLNFRGAVNDLNSIVYEWSKKHNRECYLVAEPIALFKKDVFDRLPLYAKALGCEPDYNAYTGEPNPKPADVETDDYRFRTGAGHLHIGWTEKAEGFMHMDKCMKLVRQLDFTVGLVTLLFDDDPRRRSLYGKAGAFRPKPYGLEYRVPSNAWCKSEVLAKTMYQGCIKAICLLNEGEDLNTQTEGLARDCINNNKTAWHVDYPLLADKLLGDYRDNLAL